ncbi:MAG TPA: hypothetical protein PLN61_02235 [bacterium]|nr:hypothetical protein [bacterium]
MNALIGFLIMIAAVAWVVAPLFRARSPRASRSGEAAHLDQPELLFRKKVAMEIIQDLHFDHQTGKLSQEDHDQLVREQEEQLKAIESRLAARPEGKNKGRRLPGKLTIWILLALAVLPAADSLAQNASFSGRLLDGSRDSSAVAGAPVILQFFTAEHPPRNLMTQTTGRDGAFSFHLTVTDSGASYIAMVEHQGVRYYSGEAEFSHNRAVRNDIVRFDSTRDSRGIVVLMHHIILQDQGASLTLRETRVLRNPGNKTILNALTDGHETEALLKIILPPWAQHITPMAGQFGPELKVHGNLIYDTGVFEPGNRQISFTYDLPWQKERAPLAIQIDQPTRSLDLFLPQTGLRLEGSGVQDLGPFTIRGTTYQRFGVENAMPGTRLQLQVVRNAPAAVALPPWLTLAATGSLLILGVGLARAYTARNKKGAR